MSKRGGFVLHGAVASFCTGRWLRFGRTVASFCAGGWLRFVRTVASFCAGLGFVFRIRSPLPVYSWGEGQVPLAVGSFCISTCLPPSVVRPSRGFGRARS